MSAFPKDQGKVATVQWLYKLYQTFINWLRGITMTPEQSQTLQEKLDALQASDEAARNAMLAMLQAINSQAEVIECLIKALRDADIHVELPESAELNNEE